MLKNIYGINPDELSLGNLAELPAYRTGQLFSWLYKHLCSDPNRMLNLPIEFRSELQERYSFHLPEIESRKSSQDGSTKYRLKLQDGAFIESVIIPAEKKRTLCISTQVGCSRNCSFCTTAKQKLSRNLEIDEIVTQIIIAAKELREKEGSDAKLSNLVLMGMGEPLDNIDNVFSFLRLIQDNRTLAFSPRRTTLSTCGVIPGIIKMADSGIKAKLAISLNSAIDEKRNLLMPVNRQYPLNELKQALLYFRRKSTFRITIEYILIPEVNMAAEDIKALQKFVGDISCKINFIPFNPGLATAFKAPSSKQIEDFMHKARSLPQAVMLRQSRGADVFGACGQLGKTKD